MLATISLQIRQAADWVMAKVQASEPLRSPDAYRAKVIRNLAGDPDRVTELLAERAQGQRPRSAPPSALPSWEPATDGPQGEMGEATLWPPLEKRSYLPIWEWLERRRPELLERLDDYARREGWEEINSLQTKIKGAMGRAAIFKTNEHAWQLQAMVDEQRGRFIFAAERLLRQPPSA